jgi:DNA repair exonuclease SbcCD nuclease subunit
MGMSEIRFLTSSDEHLTDLAPGFRKDDYGAEILSMLEWQGELARKFGAHAVLRGGDFFHVKAANKTKMRVVAQAARIHRRYSCPIYVVAGNHDMSNNEPGSVPGQPLGVLLHAGVFELLENQIFEDGTLRVRVRGVSYTTDLDVDGLQDLVRKGDENISLAVVHLLAAMAPSERIQSFFNERVFDYRDLIFNGCPDAYVFGHYHKDQGIVEHMEVKFINLGALARGALTFENMERKPKVCLIRVTPNGVDAEEVVVPHKPAEEIFDLERKATNEQGVVVMDKWLDKYVSDATIPKINNVEARMAALQPLPQEVRELCLELLKQAEPSQFQG